MGTVDRRTFLKLAGIPAATAAFPGIQRALEIPAESRKGSIEDVEHVVILLQENRSFDHYFGTLRGARGFADPHPATFPSGRSVFHQPNGTGELLPFRPDVADLGKTYLPDPPHGWNDSHGAWNGGRYDAWVANKGTTTMAYHTRADLPYQFALADAFTVCDNYHCSLMGPTDPNRYHMWTGWTGNDGKGGGPVITNAEAGYDWSTYPERLERAGISWKVYQDTGVGLDAAGSWGWTGDQPYIGNYGDNALLYFHQYQNAAPGSPLARGAKTGTSIRNRKSDPLGLLTDFRADVAADRLPQVTWIVAPEAYTEHPNWAPDLGAWYTSQVVDILASNPAVWGRMALFVTYDEDGGFFDHQVSPTPPATRAEGLSTVPVTNEIFPGDASHPAGPYGLGVRVPMIVVSPWTRGGWVDSQLFDHTSLIRFLETRFGRGRADLVESNITAWRRAVVGDLTSAFDFRTPNAAPPALPSTADFKPVDLVLFPDEVPVPPAVGHLPGQEQGVRPARALPYTLHADGTASGTMFTIEFRNAGPAAAVLQVRSADPAQPPRSYTVEPGKRLTDTWDAASGHDLSVHGPNGFFRRFQGGGPANLAVTTSYDGGGEEITLTVRNVGRAGVRATVTDRYAKHASDLTVKAGRDQSRDFSIERSRGWYGLVVTAAGDARFRCELAGHVENGRASISDPAMGGLV
jgi:phospholipase C